MELCSKTEASYGKVNTSIQTKITQFEDINQSYLPLIVKNVMNINKKNCPY